jgi:hypothetical protein
MAAYEVQLELGKIFIGNADFAELAEAGVDAVDGEVGGGGAAYGGTGLLHLGDGGGGESESQRRVGDLRDLVEREGLSTELQHSDDRLPLIASHLKSDSTVEYVYVR